MGRCVIERPRRGSANPSAKARRFGVIRFDPEDGYYYDGLLKIPLGSRQHAYHKRRGDKDFTDVLGPVFGYLRKHCGHPWDAVFSELDRVLGGGSYPMRHVLHDHILHPMRQGHGYFEIDGHGILRELPRTRWRWHPEKEPLREIGIGENRCYLKINEIWYSAATRICPPIGQPQDPEWPVKRVKDGYRIVEHKKQLNKKELRDLFHRPEFAQC
jgi:hypothetical protein